MKKAGLKTLIPLALFCALRLEKGKLRAGAWFKKTHINIVTQAFEILKNDGKARDIKLLEAYSDRITQGAVIPDVKGDIDNGSGLHYYNVKNKFGLPTKQKKNYFPNRLGSFSKSAGTMLEENYYTALIFWQNYKYNTSALLLGRAIHFLSDICCVPHTTSRICTGSPKNCHFAYETHANRLVGVYNSMTGTILYDKFLEITPIEIANYLGGISSGYYEKLVENKSSDFDMITASTLPLAQTACAGLLNKFLMEAEGEKLIDENEMYSIKNCESGLYLYPNGELKAEKTTFKPVFNNEGTVSFTCEDGKKLDISGKYNQFKLSLKDKHHSLYRLTCGKKFKSNLYDIPILKLARPGSYNPESDSELWILKKE